MSFKKMSGNAACQPKGIPNKCTQLAKFFEAYSIDLIAKAVVLALGGNAQALEFCIERLIPKAEHAPTDFELSCQFNLTNFHAVKSLILRATLERKINLSEAGKFIIFLKHKVRANRIPIPDSFPTGPNEAD